jgi:hypothetical protein
VTVSGLLIFISRGSFFQLMLTTLICLGFGFSSAWCQPYESRLSNLFKVATEVSLLITLCVSMLLRVDQSSEKLPALLSAADGGGIDRDAVGVMLVLANTLVPATSLLVGLVSFGLGVADVADAGADCEARLDHPPKCGEIINPFRGSSASDASDLASFRVSEIDVCDPSDPRASVLRHSLLE